MQGEKFAVSYHLAGTLAANHTITFKFPFAVTFIGLSVGAQNANDATVTFGTTADPDGYMTAQAVGDSGTPNLYDKDDLDGALLPSDHVDGVDNLHIAAETAITFVVDFDGSAGTAAQQLTLNAYFVEG